jgi:hypothetical protein
MRVILLVQTNSLANLRQQRTELDPLLALPGVAGFSLRIPSRVANPSPGDWSPLHALAAEAGDMAGIAGGKEVQLRTMYGRWAPRHASPYWGRYPGGSLGGTDVNLPPFDYPLTFSPDGSLNQTFLEWIFQAQDRMLEASEGLRGRGLPCSVVHMSHPAGTWAEVFVIEQMAEYPGFSVDRVVEAHELVMYGAAIRCAPAGFQAEFALSGHVQPGSIRGEVFGALGNVARAEVPVIIINRNDIRNETRFDNMPTDYPLGWQSYAAGNTYKHNGATVTYDWPLIFDQADAHDVVYYEAYSGNFSPEFRETIQRYEDVDPCAELRAENDALVVRLAEAEAKLEAVRAIVQ